MWERFHKIFDKNSKFIFLKRAFLTKESHLQKSLEMWEHFSSILPPLLREIGQNFNSLVCICYLSPLKILLQNSFIEFWLAWAWEGCTEILYPHSSFVNDYCFL